METKKIYELYYNIPDDGNYYHAIDITDNLENLALSNFIQTSGKVVTITTHGLLINKSSLILALRESKVEHLVGDIRNSIQFLSSLYTGKEFSLSLNPMLIVFLKGLYYGS